MTPDKKALINHTGVQNWREYLEFGHLFDRFSCTVRLSIKFQVQSCCFAHRSSLLSLIGSNVRNFPKSNDDVAQSGYVEHHT